MEHEILAAVDLGSNSFSLQVGRVFGNQIYPIDRMKETVRLAAGLDAERRLDAGTQERALEVLARFGERLRGMPAESVRVVGTNTLRVARDADAFVARAAHVVGFPIDIVSGIEEARLIFIGAAHSLPLTEGKRLVVDIGGGSTELIIGRGLEPLRLDSLFMGCVSMTARFFSDGIIDRKRMNQARLAARAELQGVVRDFLHSGWQEVVGTSGTAKALSLVIQANDFGGPDITAAGLERVRETLIKAGHIQRVEIAGLRGERRAVLPGGIAIMEAVFQELGIQSMRYATGALRDGVLHDLLGRFNHEDARASTVAQMMRRYHVDSGQARRVRDTAARLHAGLADGGAPPLLEWACLLHEMGLSIAHAGYHKHSAYVAGHADMPGFSQNEQRALSELLLAHRGKLAKAQRLIDDPRSLPLVLCLRLAVLLRRNRDGGSTPLRCESTDAGFTLHAPAGWLAANPLTRMMLDAELGEWTACGRPIALVVDG